MVESSVNTKYKVGEHVDCLDTCGKWCDATITEVQQDTLSVTFTGFTSKYNEEIPIDSTRILKQWHPTSKFKLNNRLDILDQKNKWLEATVIHIYEMEGRQCGIRVKFKGFTSKWDENLNLDNESDRIQPIGTFSKAHGWAKFDTEF